jgi:hypothetical protein
MQTLTKLLEQLTQIVGVLFDDTYEVVSRWQLPRPPPLRLVTFLHFLASFFKRFTLSGDAFELNQG